MRGSLLFLAALGAMLPTLSALAATAPEDKIWQKRTIILLGDNDSAEVQSQAVTLQKGREQLKTREVEILSEQRPNGLLHKRFGHGKGFLFLLLGKDGEEKLRSTKPVALSKITGLIDEMPMRKEEVKEAAEGKR